MGLTSTGKVRACSLEAGNLRFPTFGKLCTSLVGLATHA
jgi:hypothetical protein